jgi:hypothetical protein
MSQLRRFIALALLVGYLASSAEAVLGVVRDGSVHHESMAAAAIHQGEHHGEHGHEDPGVGAEHDAEHQHGTSSDHCTHAHGMSLPAFCAFSVQAALATAAEPTPPLMESGVYAAVRFRPPKA